MKYKVYGNYVFSKFLGEVEAYIVECVISADHYKTLAKPIYIYVR